LGHAKIILCGPIVYDASLFSFTHCPNFLINKSLASVKRLLFIFQYIPALNKTSSCGGHLEFLISTINVKGYISKITAKFLFKYFSSFREYFFLKTFYPKSPTLKFNCRYLFHPVVSVSPLTWFIRYIYYWNLQFLNVTRYDYNITIMKSPKLATDNWFKK
jgi:hypothetical protein